MAGSATSNGTSGLRHKEAVKLYDLRQVADTLHYCRSFELPSGQLGDVSMLPLDVFSPTS